MSQINQINLKLTFFNQAVLLHEQKVMTQISISWEQKKLLRCISLKAFLNIFIKLSADKNCARPKSAPLMQVFIGSFEHIQRIQNTIKQ